MPYPSRNILDYYAGNADGSGSDPSQTENYPTLLDYVVNNAVSYLCSYA